MLLVCAATARELLSALPEGALAPLPGAACDPAAQAALPEQELLPLRLPLPALACITGVGPVNAALGMGLALASARHTGQAVSLVLNVGVAGSMDLERAPLCSLWRVEEEIWPDYGLHDGTAVDGPSFGFPQWEGPHGPVFDRLPLPAPRELPACLRGLCSLPAAPSLSVAGVSASRERVARLRGAHPGALLENMEGFAVALACARQGIACVEVRSVSNRVGPRAPHETDFPGAMRRLAHIWRPAP